MQGVEILIDPEPAKAYLKDVFPEAVEQIGFLGWQIRRENGAMFIRSLPEINHILNEMYQVDPKVETYYLKLKILELLLLIRMVTPEEEKAQKRYYRQQDYDKVRAIHKEVVSPSGPPLFCSAACAKVWDRTDDVSELFQ